MFDSIIDANVNRVSEGLRVIEDYVRFVRSHHGYALRLSAIRKELGSLFPTAISHLVSREGAVDVRAKEVPVKRLDIHDLLIANFKRVTQGLRVLEEYTGRDECNVLRYDVYDLESAVLLLSHKPFFKKGFYLISDDPSCLKEGIRWGCSMVQLRDKQASKEMYLNKAQEVALFARDYKIPFIVNDFIDIAMLVDADGVHTGQDELPVQELRRLWGANKVYGRTTHTHDQGLEGKAQGADYVSVGPVFKTPSKPYRDGIGFDYLSQAVDLSIPYVAIGGIDEQTIDEVMQHSPFMVGVIRAFKQIPVWQKRYFI